MDGNENKYNKGRRSEYYVKNKLEKRGYVVARAAGSHTPADLYAARDGKVLLVQVKRGVSKSGRQDYLAPQPSTELITWAKHFKAKPMLAFQDESGIWHIKNIETDLIYINMEMI